ncbi:MAG: hypothetical protein WCE64_11870 [Bacteroidales bacterium]
MENISVSVREDPVSANPEVLHTDRNKSTHGVAGFFPAIMSMIAEDGENFFYYLKRLGLSRENNLVVLSSRHHYFYDENELRHVSTLVNLRKLNMVKYLDEFLFNLVQVLPHNSNLLGCFADNSPSGKGEIFFDTPIRFLKGVFKILDSRMYRYLDRKKVKEILEANGFQLVDMTEMNGITYFCSRKVRKQVRLSA